MSESLETFVLTCRTGTVPQVVSELRGRLKGREDVLGCWTTDVGVLNEIMLLTKGGDTSALLEASPDVLRTERTRWTLHGDILPQLDSPCAAWEWRIYDILPGCEDEAVSIMHSALVHRASISPLYALMTSRDGPSRLCHIWPYADLGVRAECRKQALASGFWPPVDIYRTIGVMRNMILSPVGI